MYKVMLVDDEAGVRNSIKAKINWEAVGFQIDSEAVNGEQALQQLYNHPLPDLIISDIRMPQMDGITFIKLCKERFPEIRIVVLSGYSDFEYMKAAIQFGVKDYLLKPVIRSELSELLAKLAAELAEGRYQKEKQQSDQMRSQQQLRILQEQMLLQLVSGGITSREAVKERLHQLQLTTIAKDDLAMQFVTVEMRIPIGRLDDWSERKDLLQLSFQMVCREASEMWPGIYPFLDVSQPSMMQFLILLDPEREADGFASKFVRELKRQIKHYLRLDSIAGIGEPIRELQQLKNGFASSMLAWSQSTAEHTADGGDSRASELTQAFTPELERKLIYAIEQMDIKAFMKHMNELITSDMPMIAFTFVALRMIMLLNAVAGKFELGDAPLQKHLNRCQMAISEYRSREQVVEQLEQLAGMVIDEVRKTRFSGGQHLIEAVRKYIDENYGYELTLSSLAEMFHFNETYLSGLFKQNAGITFSDYVTKLRMAKAEQLLRENELKLTDIATLVGYSSSSYFSTSFKKHFGVSPKEYREEHSPRQ
jgi:two-component system response regulator YesN